jgi:hypothetical protein
MRTRIAKTNKPDRQPFRSVDSATKRLPFLILCALVPTALPTASALADDGYVGIYSDSLGSSPCTVVEQYSGTTLYVIAKTVGGSEDGIRGAEFRIEVTNPSGWILSYTPTSAANVVLGNPIDTEPDPDSGGGLNLGFPSCVAPDGNGQIRLGTLSVFNLSGDPTELRVKRHSEPSNAGYACPLFVKCDFSLLCMTPAPADSCTVGTEKGVVAAAGDPACFVAMLNRDVVPGPDPGPDPDPDPDPDPELPPDNGPQLLAMLKAGAVSLPAGETRAALARTTIRSAQLATILADHDVQAISKAFPNFDPADTLATARTGETVRLMDYSRIYRLSLPMQGGRRVCESSSGRCARCFSSTTMAA